MAKTYEYRIKVICQKGIPREANGRQIEGWGMGNPPEEIKTTIRVSTGDYIQLPFHSNHIDCYNTENRTCQVNRISLEPQIVKLGTWPFRREEKKYVPVLEVMVILEENPKP